MMEVSGIEFGQFLVGLVAKGFVIVSEISSDVWVRDSPWLNRFLKVEFFLKKSGLLPASFYLFSSFQYS